MMSDESGLIMVVDGPIAIYREALRSVASIRDAMPDLSIAWATSTPHYRCALADERLDLEPGSPFLNKIHACLSSPYARSILLDADTFMVRPVPRLLDGLTEHDFQICRDEPYEYFFNTGVFSFRETGRQLLIEASERLSAIPPHELIRGNREQKVITDLLHQGVSRRLGISIAFLDPCEYNMRGPNLAKLDAARLDKIKILHYHDMAAPMKTYFPAQQERFAAADQYANRTVDELIEDPARHKAAVDSMRRIVDAYPHVIEGYLALASLYEVAKDFPSAIDVLLSSGQAHNTEPGKAIYHAARLSRRAGRTREALILALEAAAAAAVYYHPAIQGTKANAIRFAQQTAEENGDLDIAAIRALSGSYHCSERHIRHALDSLHISSPTPNRKR